MSAIQAAVKIILHKNVHKRKITILSDSKAAIKALHPSVINYKAVYDCCRCLNEMANRYITWVSGHRHIPGNCRMDDLFRRGTANGLSDEFSTLGIPLCTYRLVIDDVIVDLVNSRWAASDKGRTTRKILPRLDRRRTAALLKLQRSRLSAVIWVITEHGITVTHARRIDLEHLANDFCRSCGNEEDDETIIHLLCTCPALDRRRKRQLDAYYMEDLDVLACMHITSLRCFIESSEWFLKWGGGMWNCVRPKCVRPYSIGGTTTTTYLLTIVIMDHSTFSIESIVWLVSRIR